MEFSPAISPEKCLFAFNLVKAFRDYTEQVQGNLDLVKFDGCSLKSHEILEAFGVSLGQVQGHRSYREKVRKCGCSCFLIQ
jgi:hypothetical protein